MLAAVHRIPKPAFKRFYVKQKKKKMFGVHLWQNICFFKRVKLRRLDYEDLNRLVWIVHLVNNFNNYQPFFNFLYTCQDILFKSKDKIQQNVF